MNRHIERPYKSLRRNHFYLKTEPIEVASAIALIDQNLFGTRKLGDITTSEFLENLTVFNRIGIANFRLLMGIEDPEEKELAFGYLFYKYCQ